MTELQLNGDALELGGLRVATLEPNVQFEGSLRGHLEELLARAGQGKGDGESDPLVKAEPQALTACIWRAIAHLRAKDYEAAQRTLTEIVGGDALTPSAQTAEPWGRAKGRSVRVPR